MFRVSAEAEQVILLPWLGGAVGPSSIPLFVRCIEGVFDSLTLVRSCLVDVETAVDQDGTGLRQFSQLQGELHI